MYYYIMEAGSAKLAAGQEKIKDILGDLGIAGETVSPTPARTIEELASLGIMKGYSTIVAVGSEKLVNKIVTAIINQTGGKETVLGVIPSDFNGQLAKRIGVRDVKEACQALKFRKLETIDACQIDPNKYFLTEAIVETGRSVDAYLRLDEIQAGLIFNKIIIKPGLEIEVIDQSQESVNRFKGFWAKLFGKKVETKDIYTSFFQSQTLKLETLGKILPVKVDDEIITKTPVICSARPKALKIVVARDTIRAKE
jgi:diacylglycerol kinase family enzyme